MKAIFINSRKLKEVEVIDFNFADEFNELMNEHKLMESHIIYFSAGESKIKEILISSEPVISV